MFKKVVSTVMALILVVGLSACSVFSNENLVKFDEKHSHKDPSGLEYDKRITMKNKNFASQLEGEINQIAMPDTTVVDKDGNMVGMYDYDPKTGKASGWTDFAGQYNELEKEVDLGMPDPAKTVKFDGEATLAAVVYGNKDEVKQTSLYVFYTDSKDKDKLIKGMDEIYGIKMEAEGEDTLKASLDEKFIAEEFSREEDNTKEKIEKKNAETFADILKTGYGLREFGGPNPFKPYAKHEDPKDIKFDKKVTLTGSGAYSLEEKDEGKIKSTTDVVYAKDGNVVAHYCYYEFNSKEDADAVLESYKDLFKGAEKVEDTVIKRVESGEQLEKTLSSMMGYDMIKDKSIEEYVKMIEETYFSSPVEE